MVTRQGIAPMAGLGLADEDVLDRLLFGDEAPDAPQVYLAIPADVRHLRLARLTIAGLAGDHGWSYDSIEDLRLAVDELCFATISGLSAGATLKILCRADSDRLDVAGACEAPSPTPVLDPIGRDVLEIVTDEYALDYVRRHRTFRMRKVRDAVTP